MNISGFVFEDEEYAAQAKREEEGVRFIKEKSSLNNPEVVLKLYTTVLQQELFSTPVGLRFLMELQEYLLNSDEINAQDVPLLNPADYMPKKTIAEPVTKQKKQERGTVSGANYRNAFYVSLFFAIVFGICVIGMFVITRLSGNNVNILNYREEIINEYEHWEAELEEKEVYLREWEERLSDRESKELK